MSEELLSFSNDERWFWEGETVEVTNLPKPAMAQVLYDVVQARHPVLARWVDVVVPRIMVELSLRPAKGLSEGAARDFVRRHPGGGSEENRVQGLTRLPDQSMAVHLLNAALGGWTIVDLAELGDEQRELYLAGVTLHDLNKLVDEDLALTPVTHEAYGEALHQWAERLGLWEFTSKGLWEDIAFLAQNAESKRGENRSLANYGVLKHPPADLEDLSTYVRVADLLASVCRHPEDAQAHTGTNALRDELRRSLQHRGQYEFRYHKTVENHGLLTQLIHNAFLDEAQKVGWVPLLFFPDGVTYIAPKGSASPSVETLPGRIRSAITDIATEHTAELVARDGKGIKYQPEFTELLDEVTAGHQLISRTLDIIREGKNSVAAERRNKTVLRPGSTVALDLGYPVGLAVDRLAEAGFGLSKVFRDYYPDANDAENRLVGALGMEGYLEAFRAIAVTGGVGYHWYYVAGHFTGQHPGLSPAELETFIGRAYARVLQDLGPSPRGLAFAFLEAYVSRVLIWEGIPESWDFATELKRYERSKDRGRRICAICNSPFETREDFSIYSNKKVASPHVQSGRGICDVCRAEELLRRFTFGKTMRQGDETKYLHLYPSYYFTPLTAEAMAAAYRQIQGVVFQDIAKHLNELGFSLGSLTSLDVFQILGQRNEKRRIDKVRYSGHYLHSYYLVGLPFPGKDPTDTETWFMPALLALLAPVLFGVKAVVSGSAIPTYGSGAEFPDTVVLDGPHPFWRHFMRLSRYRLDELETAIPAALSLYGLTADAYRDGQGFPVWNQLGSVARMISGDLLSVFGYADRIQHAMASAGRKGGTGAKASGGGAVMSVTDGLTPQVARRLLHYYGHLRQYETRFNFGGEGGMEVAKGIVDRYLKFYRPEGFAAHARLRPLSLVLDVILGSPSTDSAGDLQLKAEGAIHAMLDRVRQGGAQGFVPKETFKTEDALPVVEDFVQFVMNDVFATYCGGDRAVLRQRMNALKDACEVYYMKESYARRRASREEGKE